MLKGTVKSLAINGRGKKIYRSGDPVTEENFPEGNFTKLVSEGHIILGQAVKEPVTILNAVEAAKREKAAREEREAEEAADAQAAKEKVEAAELDEMKAFADSESISYPEDVTVEGMKKIFEEIGESKKAEALEDAKKQATELGIEYSDDATIEDVLELIANVMAENELAEATKAIAEFKGKDFTSEKGVPRTVKSISDITVKELNYALKMAGLQYNTNSSKNILFFKWISLK